MSTIAMQAVHGQGASAAGALGVVYEAEVLSTATAWTDPLRVVLRNAEDHGTIRHDVIGWPRPGAALPVKGARCVVVFDDAGEATVVAWKSSGWGHDA